MSDRSSDYNPENPELSDWVSNVNKGPYKEAAERETQGLMKLKQGAAASPGEGGGCHRPRNAALEAGKGDRTVSLVGLGPASTLVSALEKLLPDFSLTDALENKSVRFKPLNL